MKQMIAFLAGLTLLAANTAMASKARLEALNQDGNGSLYIEDNRNILLNPAAVTKFGNFALIEVGNAGEDTPTTPDAQGGFVMEGGNLTYGLFLGHEDATTRKVLSNLMLPTHENTVEFFVGGQAGVAWGTSVWYSAVDGISGDPDAKLSTMGLRLGATADMWQAFAHVGLSTTAEKTGGPEFEGTQSIKVGGSYDLGTGKVYADYAMGGAEITAGGATNEVTGNGYEIGWANTQEIEENAFFFYSVAYAATADDNGTAKSSTSSLPFTLGFEADANSWLAFRGSVKQPIVINTKKEGSNTFSDGDDTTVGAGASLKFDKLRIDGTAFSSGKLNAADLLGRVALTYTF